MSVLASPSQGGLLLTSLPLKSEAFDGDASISFARAGGVEAWRATAIHRKCDLLLLEDFSPQSLIGESHVSWLNPLPAFCLLTTRDGILFCSVLF